MCNLYSSKDLLSSENNSTYSHYCQKSWQQKWVHPKCSGLKTNQSRRSWVRNNLWRVNHLLPLHLEVYFDQPKTYNERFLEAFEDHFESRKFDEFTVNKKICAPKLTPFLPSFLPSPPHNRCFNSHITSDTPKFSHGHMTSHECLHGSYTKW